MSRPPLPILTTVAESYRSLVSDLEAFAHAATGWCVLALGSEVLLLALARNDGQHSMAVTIGSALFFVAGMAVAITWHRLVLLKERPRGPLPVRLEVAPRYLAYVLLIFVLIAAAAGVIGAALWYMPRTGLMLVVVLTTYIAAFLAIGRLLLVLPAAAIGERRMTARASWAFTVNNGWRLFAGLSLTAVPPIGLSALIWAGVGERLPLLAAAISLTLSFANVALVAGFASAAYRHFTETARDSA